MPSINSLRPITPSWQRATLLMLPLTSFCGLTMTQAMAQTQEPDFLTLRAGVEQVWDSNFARTPEADSDYYTHSSVGATVNKAFVRHRFRGDWSAHRYDYAQRTDLDTHFNEGSLAWRADWQRWLTSNLSWRREARTVDQQEFVLEDVVLRDDAEGKLTLGDSTGFIAAIGGRDSEQTHTSDLRDRLEYGEQEVYGELGYGFSRGSSVLLRYRDGKRDYTEDNVPPLFENLDYTYETTEVEFEKVGNGRTRWVTTLGYFDRVGEVNDGDGGLASIAGDWELSEKTLLHASYTYREPVVGEEADSPVEEDIYSAGLDWDIGPKLAFASSLRVVNQEYERLRDGPARDETIYRVMPLQLTYRPRDYLSLRFSADWRERQSPLADREYDATTATLAVNFTY